MDYKEYCVDVGGLEHRTVQDMYIEIGRYLGSHTHQDLKCESRAGNIIVPPCNGVCTMNNGYIRTLDQLKTYMSRVKCLDDESYHTALRYLDNVESQRLVNKIYPFMEDDEGPVDLYAKNQRLQLVKFELDKVNLVRVNRNELSLEQNIYEYKLDYRGVGWNRRCVESSHLDD